MIDMKVPSDVSTLTVDGTEYSPDEWGMVSANPAHVETLQALGCTLPAETATENADDEDAQERSLRDRLFDTQNALDDEGRAHGKTKESLAEATKRAEDLSTQVRSLQQTVSQRDAEVAALRGDLEAARAATGTTEGTSGTQQTGPAPFVRPDVDSMTRDDMVAWLRDNGVSVPSSISKADATKAVNARADELESK